MLVYLVAAMIMVWYVIVAHQTRSNMVVWSLVGLVSFLGSYWVWKLGFQEMLVRDTETLVWFLIVGVLIGVMVAIIVLGALTREAVARATATGEDDRPHPVNDPPPLQRRRYLVAFGVAVSLAVVSVFLQKLGIIHNEIGPGGMYPAGLAGAVGGTLLRRPLRSLVLGIGLGLVYAACYAPGLNLIGKMSLRGSEAVAGAFIGLPLLMIMPAAAFGFLSAVVARSLRAIAVRTHWLAARS